MVSFSIIDFIIGLTLVNALPHFVLGVWNGRILGAFGFGNTANILYGLFNLAVSIGLVVYEYGLDGLTNNAMYLGGLFVVLSYVVFGKFLYTIFQKKSEKS